MSESTIEKYAIDVWCLAERKGRYLGKEAAIRKNQYVNVVVLEPKAPYN